MDKLEIDFMCIWIMSIGGRGREEEKIEMQKENSLGDIAIAIIIFCQKH